MTLQQQLDCLRRELALRRNTYPKWVQANKMTQTKADHEIGAMVAAVETMQKVAWLNEAGIAWVTEREGK